jgi:tyrosyl-tRNA synthetase
VNLSKYKLDEGTDKTKAEEEIERLFKEYNVQSLELADLTQ